MFTRQITVQPSDVSSQGIIKLRSLLNYFQDTASIAVADIEGNTTEFVSRGYSWVLTRYEIEFIGRLPELDENFTLTTYHDPSHGYNTFRVFHLNSHDGTPSVYAKTSWLLLDLAAGRPVKPASHLPEILARDTEDISPDFRDIPDYNGETVRSVTFPVRFHDIDYNAHVNNAAYFEWVHDYAPIDLNTYRLKSICASFRSGAKLGENITLDFSQDGETTLCRIVREGVKKPSANFVCVWQKEE